MEALLDLYVQLKGDKWKNNFGWAERHFLHAQVHSSEDWLNLKKPVCTWYGITCADGAENDESGVTNLDLSFNNLIGDIPSLLWQMPTLRDVNLKGNSIQSTGLEGVELQNATKAPIKTLILSENNLNGLDGIGKLTTLKNLQIDKNKLHGKFSEEFLMLKNLEKLDLSLNQMTGPLPTTIGSLTRLRKHLLNDNVLDGTLPTELEKLVDLERYVIFSLSLLGKVRGRVSLFSHCLLSFLFLTLRWQPRLDILGNKIDDVIPTQALHLQKLANAYEKNDPVAHDLHERTMAGHEERFQLNKFVMNDLQDHLNRTFAKQNKTTQGLEYNYGTLSIYRL